MTVNNVKKDSISNKLCSFELSIIHLKIMSLGFHKYMMHNCSTLTIRKNVQHIRMISEGSYVKNYILIYVHTENIYLALK